MTCYGYKQGMLNRFAAYRMSRVTTSSRHPRQQLALELGGS
jgi:hypothetical protein